MTLISPRTDQPLVFTSIFLQPITSASTARLSPLTPELSCRRRLKAALDTPLRQACGQGAARSEGLCLR